MKILKALAVTEISLIALFISLVATWILEHLFSTYDERLLGNECQVFHADVIRSFLTLAVTSAIIGIVCFFISKRSTHLKFASIIFFILYISLAYFFTWLSLKEADGPVELGWRAGYCDEFKRFERTPNPLYW